MPRMTATEAARGFSEVLNRVAEGEEIEVVRNGRRIAVISAPTDRLVSSPRFRELIASAPSPDDGFAEELRDLRASVGPPDTSWPS